jgi:hypothetical protein
MRSSARSWAAAHTDVAPFVAEVALAHVNEDRVEAAYQRDLVIEARRARLQAWGECCAQPNVIQIDQVRMA